MEIGFGLDSQSSIHRHADQFSFLKQTGFFVLSLDPLKLGYYVNNLHDLRKVVEFQVEGAPLTCDKLNDRVFPQVNQG